MKNPQPLFDEEGDFLCKQLKFLNKPLDKVFKICYFMLEDKKGVQIWSSNLIK